MRKQLIDLMRKKTELENEQEKDISKKKYEKKKKINLVKLTRIKP